MTWLWVILIVAAIGGIIGWLTSGTKEGAAEGAATAGIGCGYIIFQIFLAVVGLYVLFLLGSWLFG
jgi:hypothetical protein